MNKIKRVSVFFRIIFQCLFLIIPMFCIVGWILAPHGFQTRFGEITVIPQSYHHHILHTLSISEKLLGFTIDAIPMLFQLFIVYSFIRLFYLYEKGEIFSLQNVKYLRNAGYGFVFYEITRMLADGILGIPLTMHNPTGYRVAQITFDQTNFGLVFLGLFMVLISWIMIEGCKLRDEQQLVI